MSDDARPSVFIVEDEEALREVYSGFLPMSGFDIVGEARDGQDAVQQVGALARRPDVILMDHRMPHKSGIQASKELLAKDPGHTILFVTADLGVERQAKDVGVKAVLVKPFAMDELTQALKMVTRSHP